ncbi:MAG: phosphoribosylglycinamide formyltransferase [Candidatus Omnitrophica bacterium]|nr:phosphoribosylglycinamide formyltransferase [Candidatus Omnitrophota bacterium]
MTGYSKPCRLAVFCSGFGSNFQAILDAIRKRRLEAVVALMVCDNPKAHAVKRARRRRIPLFVFNPRVFKTRRACEKIIVRILKSEKVDWVILAGFMRVLTPYFVRAYRGRILNVHPALLPHFKGTHAIRDAFNAGVQETGVTVHTVTEEVDAGPVVLQERVKISKRDTLKSLEAKIHRVEHRIYPLAIQRVIMDLRKSNEKLTRGIKSPLPPLKRKGGKGFLLLKEKEPKTNPLFISKGAGGI